MINSPSLCSRVDELKRDRFSSFRSLKRGVNIALRTFGIVFDDNSPECVLPTGKIPKNENLLPELSRGRYVRLFLEIFLQLDLVLK